MKTHTFKEQTDAPKKKGTSPMDAALSYLSGRARTVREVERHLDEKQYGEYEVQQVVERLQELGYLDDAAFAKEFIESRLRSKPVSRRKLHEQLMAHEIPRDIVEEALSQIPDEQDQENALAIARKYAAQLGNLDEAEFQMRLNRRLVGRGFSYDDARAAVRAIMEEDDDAR